MPGAFDPSPRRFGQQAGRLTEVLCDSLIEANGTALTDEQTSIVYAEAQAEARCIDYLWGLNRRMSLQWNPLTMTDFLGRWETILGLTPLAGDSDLERRQRVLAKMQAYGQPGTQQVLEDLLTLLLGPVFVGLVATSSAAALGAVPGGCTVPGGVTLPSGDWRSSVALVAIETTQPALMTDATYYATVGQVRGLLDNLVGAWITFNWFRDGGAGVGFFFDDEHNFDNERFDV